MAREDKKKADKKAEKKFKWNKKKKDDKVIDVEAKEPVKKYKVIQSTQQSIPVKYISGNVVLTTDNRYIKIIEVKAIPFMLKSTGDKNKIFATFKQIMRNGPVKMQIKCLSMPGDMYKQIKQLRENRAKENNSLLSAFYDDYENRLYTSQAYSVTRRFFIIFEYVPEKRKRKAKATPDDIKRALKITARRVVASLEACGNETKELDTDETTQVFYEIYNRRKARVVPFESMYRRVVDRYLDYYKDGVQDNCYIPFEEFIAPEKVDYRDGRYLIINDDTYYRFMVIPGDGYPSYSWPGWLDNIVSFGVGIDVDFFFEKVDKTFLLTRLERNIVQANAVIGESKSHSDSSFTATQSLEASTTLLNGLRSGQEFFYVSTLITVTGSSPEEVDLYVDDLKKSFKNLDVNAIELETQYEEAFESALPLCKLDKNIYIKSRRNMLTDGAASFYPFTTFEINDPEGINLGYSYDSGSEIVVDFFNTHLFSNANGFICGMPGAGKTYSLLLMAIRCRLSRIPVIIMAPEKEHEFRRLCEAIDGTFISISKGSKEVLNPLEIFARDKKGADIDDMIDGGAEVKTSLMSSKIDSLITLFELIIGEKFTDYNERVALENLLVKTYARFGITIDNDSLWADEEKTHFKTMPIFSDVKETMKSIKTLSPKIINIIDQFTEGSLSIFNGQTNVDTTNNFIVFGLQHNDEDMMPAAMFIAMDFVWAKFQENRTQRKILFIDEWWKMAFNPVAADYSMKLARLVRGYGAGVWFATQQMTDIVASGERGLAVIGNCQTKILMRMSTKDIDAVSDMLNLTPAEEDQIERQKQGEALLIAGSTRMQIKFVASEREDLYCGTDRKTLEKYYGLKREEEAQEEEERRRINSLQDIDDVVADENYATNSYEDNTVIDIEVDDGVESFDDIVDSEPYDYTKQTTSSGQPKQQTNDVIYEDLDDIEETFGQEEVRDLSDDIDDDVAGNVEDIDDLSDDIDEI